MANLCRKCGNFFRPLILILGGLGILLSILSATSCEFVTGRWVTGNKDSHAGIFVWHDPNGDGNCEAWNYEESRMEEFIRTSAVMAPILATVGISMIAFQFFCCNICCVDILTSATLVAAAITQCFTFFIFQTEHCGLAGATCKLGTGGNMSVTAAIFFFCCGVFVCITPRSEPLMMREKAEKKDHTCNDHSGEEEPASPV